MGFLSFLARKSSSNLPGDHSRITGSWPTSQTELAGRVTPSKSTQSLNQQIVSTRPGLLTQVSHNSSSLPLRRTVSQQAITTYTITTVPKSVDLLDAQSTFKPADFRSRIQASGSRDYGEDVAERNIGINGVELHSEAVQHFYAATKEEIISENGPKTVPQTRNDEKEVRRSRSNSMSSTASAPAVFRTRSLSSVGHRPRTSHSLHHTSLSTKPSHHAPRKPSHASIGQPRLEHRPPPVAFFNSAMGSAAAPGVPRYQRPVSALSQRSFGHRSRFSRDVTCHESILEHDSDGDECPAPIVRGKGINDVRNWHPVISAPEPDLTPSSPHQSNSPSPSFDIASLQSEDSTDDTSDTETLSTYPLSPAPQSLEFDDDGYTTDGSNVEAFLAKKQRKYVPDGEALLFDVSIFHEGDLPGLCADVADQSDSTEMEDADAGCSSESDVTTSPATPTFSTQRQRMLALGFDYSSDSDEEAPHKSKTLDLAQIKGLDLDAVGTTINTRSQISQIIRRRREQKSSARQKPRLVAKSTHSLNTQG